MPSDAGAAFAAVPRLQLQASAIVRRGRSVLLHRLEGDPHWSLPGTRVEGGETAAEAVARELRDELGEPVQVGPMLWLLEASRPGARPRELSLYFHAELRADSALLSCTRTVRGVGEGARLELAWFGPRALSTIDLRPAVLKDALSRPTRAFQHLMA